MKPIQSNTLKQDTDEKIQDGLEMIKWHRIHWHKWQIVSRQIDSDGLCWLNDTDYNQSERDAINAAFEYRLNRIAAYRANKNAQEAR